MSRYVDIAPYEKCRIVSNPEDNGFPVSELQTVDAEPVRHGHWIVHVDELFPADSTQECSVCHGEEWLSIKHENYCPNCGAKMDEEARHD